MASATDIVKDGDFGVKPEKKDSPPEGDELKSHTHHQHHHHEEKTFSNLLDNFLKAKGVLAVMLMDRGGNIASSNLNKMGSGMYCGISSQILDNAVSRIEGLNSRVKFRLLRSNAGAQEVLIHPVVGAHLVLVIVQNCSDRSSLAIRCHHAEKKHSKRATAKANQLAIAANEASKGTHIPRQND